jgi:hypothetical protein
MADVEDKETSVTEMNNREFKAKIKKIKVDIQNLINLASNIGSLEKGDRQKMSDGSSVGKRELKQYTSLVYKEIDGLAKDYSQSKKQPKAKRTGGSNGFRNPMVVSVELPAYFNETNLGPAYEKIENDVDKTMTFKKLDTDLASHLPLFLNEGVTSSALLTPLFSISAKTYNMQLPDNKQYLKTTPIMNKHFSKIFKTLQERDEENIRVKEEEIQKLEDQGLPKERLENHVKELKKLQDNKFNPDRFKYARLQSLVSQCRKKEENYTKTQGNIVKDPEIKQKLLREQKIVSDTLAFYRQEGKKNKDDPKGSLVSAVVAPVVVPVVTPVVAPVVTPVATPVKTSATNERPKLRIPAKK